MNLIKVLNASPGGQRKTVVVFGCARGGTSAVAGFLRELGVMFSTTTHPLTHEWSPVKYVGDVVDTQSTRLAVEQMDECSLCWGWKSPRDIFSLPSWISLVDNPHFVVVYRNPIETMVSASRWDSVALPLIAEPIGQVLAALGAFIAYAPFPIALISYEQLRLHAEVHARELSLWLGLEHNGLTIRNAVRFVSGDQRSYRGLVSESDQDPDARLNQSLVVADTSLKLDHYTKSNKELESRIAALTADADTARQLVTSISEQVTQLSQERFLAESPCSDPTQLEDGPKSLLQGVLLDRAAAHSAESRDLEDVPDLVSPELEEDLRRAQEAHRLNWAAFSSVLRERISLQRRVEDLAWQRTCLLDAALTGSAEHSRNG